MRQIAVVVACLPLALAWLLLHSLIRLVSSSRIIFFPSSWIDIHSHQVISEKIELALEECEWEGDERGLIYQFRSDETCNPGLNELTRSMMCPRRSCQGRAEPRYYLFFHEYPQTCELRKTCRWGEHARQDKASLPLSESSERLRRGWDVRKGCHGFRSRWLKSWLGTHSIEIQATQLSHSSLFDSDKVS